MKKIFTLCMAILLFGCSSDGDSGDPAPTPDPVLSSIQISSSSGNQLDLNGSTTLTLSATGKDQFGQTIAIGQAVQWTTTNNTISVDQNGLVTAQFVGNAVVNARAGSASGNFNISVIDSSPITGTFIYVSDAVDFSTGPWKVLRYDENGQNAEIFTEQGLAWPQDILFRESSNEALISNLNSGIINRHNADTGALIASFATGINGPTRMKIGPDDLLYVLQWSGNGAVLRYQLDGTFVDEFTNVGMSRSIGLDWDTAGNLYVSSFDGASVRKFDTNGDDMGLFISSNLVGPTNIWFDGNGNLWVNDWSGDVVAKFDPDGNFIENVITSGLNQPEGIDFFANGNFLIGSGGTSQVKLYDADGNFMSNLVSAGSGGLVRPNAVRIRVID